MNKNKLLEVKNLKKYFPVTAGVFSNLVGWIKAVDNISFSIDCGETIGLAGESGCGKTTAGRTILRLIEPSEGEIFFRDADFLKLKGDQLRNFRKEMQIIFQDPFSSLNPRKTILNIVGESLESHGIAKGIEKHTRVAEVLEKVGLSPRYINRYPHEFSGGQRQRIGIARAIVLHPSLIVCDEPVSALDVSIQAQIIKLLIQLKEEMNIAYLFIAHDLAVVKYISDRIMIMYLGEIVESALTSELFSNPVHPYTRALLSAVPTADPRRRAKRTILEGDVPSPFNPPAGCHFHPRCPEAKKICREIEPPERVVNSQHFYKCHIK